MKTPENVQTAYPGESHEAVPDSKRFQDRDASAASVGGATPFLRLAYSVKEAAEILGVSEKSVRRLIIRGLLRPSRALRHLLIPRKELERFLEDTTARGN